MEDHQIVIFAVLWAVIWYFLGQFRGLMWATRNAKRTVDKLWDEREAREKEAR